MFICLVFTICHLWLRKNVRETFTQFQTQNDAGNCRYRSSLLQLFCKKVFLENSQNSQENTCTRVSFLIKLQAWGLVFSSEFCKISENSFSYTTPPVAPSIGNNVTLNYPVMTLPDNLLLICRFKDHNLVFCSLSLHKKWSFPLRISSANVTKSAGNFLCSVYIWFAKYDSWKLHLEPQTLYAIKKTYFWPRS